MVAKWNFRSQASGHLFTRPLYLYGEINLSSAVDNIYPATGEEEVEYWRDYIRRSYPDEWEADAVSVSWFIDGDTVLEASPDCPTTRAYREDRGWEFDTFDMVYTHPRNAQSGEPLRSWSDLPRTYRFKEFSRVYGFVPPHAAFVPVRTWSPWTAEPLASLGPSTSCLRCGRPLSDALSVEAGHGPWCARKALSSV